jgi:hypothetical protein
MASYLVLAALMRAVAATVTVNDPSDTILPKDWAADDAILADYDIPFISSQPRDSKSNHLACARSFFRLNTYTRTVEAVKTFSKGHNSISHKVYSVDKNDTSVILVHKGAHLTASYVDILKEGYSTNLNEASFYGFNAAVNVVCPLPSLHQLARRTNHTRPMPLLLLWSM